MATTADKINLKAALKYTRGINRFLKIGLVNLWKYKLSLPRTQFYDKNRNTLIIKKKRNICRVYVLTWIKDGINKMRNNQKS